MEVFEAAIDLMSYTEIFQDFFSCKIALGMLSDAPLVTFLQEHPQIRVIKFCLDNDEWGRNITTFIVGENVTYMDYRLLRGNSITNCYVYAVNSSEKFLFQNFTESYLPICTNLHIHYNSDFKDFFSKEVTD